MAAVRAEATAVAAAVAGRGDGRAAAGHAAVEAEKAGTIIDINLLLIVGPPAA